jgi:hypothetical protein
LRHIYAVVLVNVKELGFSVIDYHGYSVVHGLPLPSVVWV